MSARASTLFKSDDRAAIERAIGAAEARTSAEIVVVVASRSGRFDRAEDVFGLCFAVVVTGAAAVVWPQPADPGSWASGLRFGFHAGLVLLLFAASALAGAWLASACPVLLRPLVPSARKLDAVKREGAIAFHRFRVRQTEHARGVLIYVSLFEHLAWVVGDDGVAAELPDGAWDPICQRISAAFKAGEAGRGMVEALEATGELLAGPFPRDEGDTNELPNTLHLVD